MHENGIERDSLRLFMHRALILPLWWMRWHHTPWSIHAWKIEIRVWEKFPTKWDGSSWANRDHEMRMSWAWWDYDLRLHVFTPSSTFISNLHFLSLVLPYSCSFRERGRWQMREWVELGIASADDPIFHFMHMTCGAKGWVEDSSFPTHCMMFRYWRMV